MLFFCAKNGFSYSFCAIMVGFLCFFLHEATNQQVLGM